MGSGFWEKSGSLYGRRRMSGYFQLEEGDDEPRNLLLDTVVESLRRVPFKTPVRFRCVCQTPSSCLLLHIPYPVRAEQPEKWLRSFLKLEESKFSSPALSGGLTEHSINHAPSLVETGCSDGSCASWAFEKGRISKELEDSYWIDPITSECCWFKYGHHILACADDTSLGSGSTSGFPTSFTKTVSCNVSLSCQKISAGSAPFTPTAECFNKYCDLVYVRNSKGEILKIDSENVKVCGVLIHGGAVVKIMIFSRKEQYLLTNSNDWTVMIHENLSSLKDKCNTIDGSSIDLADDLDGAETLKAVGGKHLTLLRGFRSSITRIHWKVHCLSSDGESELSGSANKGEHKIYTRDTAGHLVIKSEGPNEAFIDLAWHHVHPIVVHVSLIGLICTLAEDYPQNWRAFTPYFKKLEKVEESVEHGDEFDLMPATEKVKESDINENDGINMVTVAQVPAFGGLDMSQDERCFSFSVPYHDAAEQPERFRGCLSKLVENKKSGSSLSGGQNDLAVKYASSPVEETGNANRKAFLLEKFHERSSSSQVLGIVRSFIGDKEVQITNPDDIRVVQPGHGTQCASVIGGKYEECLDNTLYGKLGIARGGFPSCQLRLYQVLGHRERGCSEMALGSAVEAALKDGVSVLNISMCSKVNIRHKAYSGHMVISTFKAMHDDVLCCVCAGNEGSEGVIGNYCLWQFTVTALNSDKRFTNEVILEHMSVSIKGYSMSKRQCKNRKLVHATDVLAGRAMADGNIVVCEAEKDASLPNLHDRKFRGTVGLIIFRSAPYDPLFCSLPHSIVHTDHCKKLYAYMRKYKR